MSEGVASQVRYYTVSQVNRIARDILEGEVPPLWVVGEVSNFHQAASGHMYFTLKDARSQLRGVMFRRPNQRLGFQPQNGLQVAAFGQLTLYEREGQYQLVVSELEPVGIGVRELAFQQLKARLEAEGLFDPARKKPLPFLPRAIGVVTSTEGAALRDILTVLQSRCPAVTVIVRPTAVQGESAATEIAQAIDEFNRYGGVDLLIVGRGGGSLEDLWAFNEEAVARAIFRSRLPIVSAVGHETDITLADLVADRRAPTPSVAASLAVPDRAELGQHLARTLGRLLRSQAGRVAAVRRELNAQVTSHGLRRILDRWQQYAQALDHAVLRLRAAGPRWLERREFQLSAALAKLELLSPLATLRRGYAIAFRVNSPGTGSGRRRTLLRSSRQVEPGDRVRIVLGEGQLDCQVDAVHHELGPLE